MTTDDQLLETVSREHSLILSGAMRTFARLGYGACTEEDIIEAAGVSPEAFAREFGDKYAVFNALEEMFAFALTQAMHSSENGDESPTAEDLLDAYLRWITIWRDVALMMWTDPTRPYSRKSDSRDSSLAEFRTVIGRISQANGQYPLDPLLVNGLAGATREISLTMLQTKKTTPEDIERARLTIDTIVRRTLCPL